MINIVSYITEKFKISKNTNISGLISKAYSFDPNTASIKRPPYISYAEAADHGKMSGYLHKGSKPSRLVNSIKDNGKLERRFSAAIDMGWDEAIEEFGQALIDRKIYSEEQIIYYIYLKLKQKGKIK